MEQLPRPETFNRLVDEALDKAYEDIGHELGLDPNKVYMERQCEKVSNVLARELNIRGIRAEIHQYKGWDITDHDFVLAGFNGEQWAVDPTWQQFLPEPDMSKPRALICPVIELEACLRENGVPEDKLHIWKI